MQQNTDTFEGLVVRAVDRFVKFVSTVFRYIELAVGLMLVGTLFLIVTILNALF